MSTTLNPLSYRAFLLNTVGSIDRRRPESLAIGFGIPAQTAPDRVFYDIRRLVEGTTQRRMSVRVAAPELAVTSYWMTLAAGAALKLPRDPHEIVQHHTTDHRLFGIISEPMRRCVQAQKTTEATLLFRRQQETVRRRLQSYLTNSAAASERAFKRTITQLRMAANTHPNPVVRQDALRMLDRMNLQNCKLLDLITIGNMLGLRLPAFTRADR